MKIKIFKVALLLTLSGLVFSGCASLGAPGDEDIYEAVRLISNGDPVILQEATRIPFLLDGEILLGESEVGLLWKGLSESGFVFSNPVIEDILPAEPEIYTLFGDTMDVEVFFRKYLTPKDHVVRISSEEGLFFLILSSRKTGNKFVGFAGGK